MIGLDRIGNAFIADELAQNRPLLYANRQHAMVVTAMDYLATPAFLVPQAVGVLDPFPSSPPFHPLQQTEMRPAHLGGDMTFLAAVHME